MIIASHCKKPFLFSVCVCVWFIGLVCFFSYLFICFIFLFNWFCCSEFYFSLSLLLCIFNLCWDELLSISVPFKVIVYFSTTIHISKHYTVQTFNLDSHKPFRGEKKKKHDHFRSGRPSQRMWFHAHSHAQTQTHRIPLFYATVKFKPTYLNQHGPALYVYIYIPLPKTKSK